MSLYDLLIVDTWALEKKEYFHREIKNMNDPDQYCNCLSLVEIML